MNFNQWIKNKKSTVVIFDFDDTIATVPKKPTTDKEKDEYGWNGKDWWGSEVSLSKNVTPHKEVIAALKKAKNDPDTIVAIVTGRRPKISHKIRAFLRSQGLFGKRIIPDSNPDSIKIFKKSIDDKKDLLHKNEDQPAAHQEYFTGDFTFEPNYPDEKSFEGTSAGTFAHKTYVISSLVNKNTKTLEIWEDRTEHIPFFKKLAADLKKKHHGLTVIFHHVHEPAKLGSQPTVSTYEI